MTNEALAIGADIGGTHITAALIDLNKKSILPGTLIREKVDTHASPTDIVEVWSDVIKRAGRKKEIKRVSLAIPGPFDYEKGICLIKDQDKYENLYGVNIRELLSEKLQNKPEDISMINDAAAFLQGEVFGGSAVGVEKAIGVTLGTGLGSCVYENNISSNANLWNLPFREGIAEEYLSTRWFINRYKEITDRKVSGVLELSALIETDARVNTIFDEFGTNLADFLIEFLRIAPSELIVLGGNIAKSFPYFQEPLLKRVNEKFPQVIIKTASLGEEAALMGAASHWKADNTTSHNHDLDNTK